MVPAWYIFSWRDMVEIGVFGSMLYYMALWLAKDKKNNLLIPFYSYCCALIGSYYFSLNTISSLLLNFSPAALAALFIMHEKTLQKNFVSFKNVHALSKQSDPSAWIETAIRSFLVAFNSSKNIICIIERSDALASFLQSPLIIESDIAKNDMLTICFESATFDENKYIWLRSNGQLVALNAISKQSTDTLADHQHEAIFLTQKTDAIIIKGICESRLFDISVSGKELKQLNSATAISILKKYCMTNNALQAGELHVPQNQKSHSQKSLS